MHTSRRLFLASIPLTVAGAGAVAGQSTARQQEADPSAYPVTPAGSAAAIVGASHANLDRVRELLGEDAGLAKAVWDWGFGDWETALGAASHTGRTDIMDVLIAHGARPDIFSLATLDAVDALRAVLSAFPSMRTLEGPHSISLFRHARAGDAARVMEYLEAEGLNPPNPFTTDQAEAAPCIGTYSAAIGEGRRFTVAWVERLACLSLTPGEAAARNLMPVGEHRYSPAGARHVTITFDVREGRAGQLHITGFGEPVSAKREPG